MDAELERLQPIKLGKPYPVGQCLEIVLAAEKHLKSIKGEGLNPTQAKGKQAFHAFQRAGGTFRQVWGDLRGQYFQNAFQLGTLYVDVANDTVVSSKPKVEILPFDQANFHPIRDFEHFRQIATSYWHDDVYPNHVLPALAPFCPLIHVSKDGVVQIQNPVSYMVALVKSQHFEPSESFLRAPAMPEEVFDIVAHALRGSTHVLARNPEQGRLLALKHCQQYRAKRWHLLPQQTGSVITQVNQANLHLAKWHHRNHLQPAPSQVGHSPSPESSPTPSSPQETNMATIKVDDREFDLDSLSPEAKQQLEMLMACENKLRELQRDTAIAQTARNAYANALKSLLPTPLEQTMEQGDTLKLG